MIKQIVIQLPDEGTLVLSLDGARQLWRELNELFGAQPKLPEIKDRWQKRGIPKLEPAIDEPFYLNLWRS